MDSGSLSTLVWGNVYSNPLNIHSVGNSLPTESTDFICSRGGVTTLSIFLSVTGILGYFYTTTYMKIAIYIFHCLVPTLVVTYGLFLADSDPLAYPVTNDLTIPLETTDISLILNIVGKWSTPDGTNITGSTFQISEFMNENVGVYTFYTNNWDGVELGILIHIQSSPAVIGM